jgi:hypothetical protein
VVFGLIGIIVIVPVVEKAFVTTQMQIDHLQFFSDDRQKPAFVGDRADFMIVPMVISLTADALMTVPAFSGNRLRLRYDALRVIWKIVLPCRALGHHGELILAAGRRHRRGDCRVDGLRRHWQHTESGYGLRGSFDPGTDPFVGLHQQVGGARRVPSVESALFSSGAVLLVFGAFLSFWQNGSSDRLRRSYGYDEYKAKATPWTRRPGISIMGVQGYDRGGLPVHYPDRRLLRAFSGIFVLSYARTELLGDQHRGGAF